MEEILYINFFTIKVMSKIIRGNLSVLIIINFCYGGKGTLNKISLRY